MSEALSIRIEWIDAPGVNAPELAATWARYEVWVGGWCVTRVEDRDGTVRCAVYGSLYPLAEWVAANWWLLRYHVGPSGIDSRHWSWSAVRQQPWLAHHNFRAAGDGMPWPNLTIVPDGVRTRAIWTPDAVRTLNAIRFVSSGDTWLPTEDVVESLAALVDRVMNRLTDAGVPETSLSDYWSAVAGADEEERAFCRTAAVLGYDPYSLDDGAALILAGDRERARETAEVLADAGAVAALADSETVVYGREAIQALIAERVARERASSRLFLDGGVEGAEMFAEGGSGAVG